MFFKHWLENIDVHALEPVSQLMAQWFAGGFMHGGRIDQVHALLDAFKELGKLAPAHSPMALFRVMPQERNLFNKVQIDLHLLSSWCQNENSARAFYYEVSASKTSPVKQKTHALVKSIFKPEEIVVVVNEVLPKLDEVLENLKDSPDFPMRLANVYHNMKWHEHQKEVIVNAPGERIVDLVQWLPG